MSRDPVVSIVIPTRNRAAMLDDCIASLGSQAFAPERFEIVVVDDGSVDGTPALLDRLARDEGPALRTCRQSGAGPNAARNAGIRLARGSLIVFIDDDVVAPPEWLGELVAGTRRHAKAGVLGGRIRLRFEGPAPRFCGREPAIGEAEFDLGAEEREVDQVISANMVVPRWAFDAVGLFDEALPIYGDELEWQRRVRAAGHAIVYLPSAWLTHRRESADLRARVLLRRYVRRGVNHGRLALRMGEPVDAAMRLRKMAGSLAHAVRRRCFLGILTFAQQTATLVILVTERRR